MLLVSERLPPLTLEARTAALFRAAEHALKHGTNKKQCACNVFYARMYVYGELLTPKSKA